MSHSVRRHLRLEIEAYDKTIRAFIPSYEEMLARAADAVAETKPKKVIDLGAGTGALTQAILQRCEGTKVELIDADPEMLDQARERLAPFAARVRVHRASVPRSAAYLRRERAYSHFAEWADEDTYFPLEDELAALADAGFDATCLWRVAPGTIVKAIKATEQG